MHGFLRRLTNLWSKRFAVDPNSEDTEAANDKSPSINSPDSKVSDMTARDIFVFAQSLCFLFTSLAFFPTMLSVSLGSGGVTCG